MLKGLLFFLFLIQTDLVQALDIVQQDDELSLGRHLDYLADPGSRLDLPQALAQSDWQQGQRQDLNFGYTRSTYWFRLNLHNGDQQPLQRLLEIAYPVLNHVDVWILNRARVVSVYHMGDALPFAARPYQHRNFVIPLQLQAGQSLQVVLRIHTASAMQVPVTLWSEARFHQHDQTNLLLLGIYYGVVICMLIYNLFLFFSLRELSGLYYVVWVGGMLMFMMSLNGIAYQYLWPQASAWNNRALVFFLSLSVLFATLFTREFLQIARARQTWMLRLLHQMALLSGLATLGAFVLPYRYGIHLSIGVAVIAIFSSFVAATLRWRDGFATARYYVFAWSFVMLGGAVMAANKLGLIERNLFTENATQVGSAMEVLLLSFALGERVNVERKLREQAQRDAFDAQRVANAQLEQQVELRTQALQEANRRLTEISVTDPLTGIPNRRHFDQRYLDEIKRAQRSGQHIGLLVIDIDHFKRVNDHYGHQSGDEALRFIAMTLQKHVRRDIDLVARFGGEEFCVLLPCVKENGLAIVAEHLRRAVDDAIIELASQPLHITISLGGSTCVPNGLQDAEELLAAADTAVYAAKHAGRNAYRFQPIRRAIE